MSSGCVHKKASIILATGFMVGGLVTGDWLSAIEYGAGSLVGIFLSPDQDVDNGYIGNTILRNRLGWWASSGWNVLWHFYRKSLKHGSELSHFPVVSTMFRLAYLFFFLLVIPYSLMELVLPGAWDFKMELSWWLALSAKHYRIILGLIGSDVIHWTLDVLTTEHAKQKQKVMIFGVPLASSTCR